MSFLYYLKTMSVGNFVENIKTMKRKFFINEKMLQQKVIKCVLPIVAQFLILQSVHAQGVSVIGLDSLKGFSQSIYFSPGNENRAKEIAVLMDNAAAYFQQELEFTPKVKLYILEPRHWKEYASFPVYGMPHNIDQVRLAIAAADNPFWQSFLPPIHQLPVAMVERINKAYRKADGTYSMQPFFDLLALHEMGHSYHAQAGLKMQRKWMQELFVNIMLHTYVAEKQPQFLPALETFPEMVVGAGSAEYKFTSLAHFEDYYDDARKGMTAKNYGWYQCNLHHAAKNIYNAGGKTVIQKLWNALKIHQEEMSNEAFVAMLQKEVHPSVGDVFLKWDENKADQATENSL